MVPLIAVTGRAVEPGRVKGWREPAVALPATYFAAVRRAGALAVLIDPVELTADTAAALLDRFDGLILTGGDDLDPALYGEQPHESTVGVDRRSDDFELALLDAAITHDVPTLAICRGLQVLNVARGGTLDQHIIDRDDLGSHGTPSALGGQPVVHPVRVDPESTLAAWLGTSSPSCVCHHHQAVSHLGDGLRAVAWAEDGVVEGIEIPGAALVAVQWHPEESAASDAQQQRLFDGFVASVSARVA